VKRESVVESHSRSTVPLGEAILSAMQAAGPAVFLRLIRDRADQIPPPAEAARSLLASAKSLALQLKSQGVRELAQRGIDTARTGLRLVSETPNRVADSVQASRDYFTKLPTVQDKTEYVASLILSLMSLTGGFAVGFQLPKVDLKMARKGNPGDRIVLHAFPVMAAELAMDWIGVVLEQVRDARNLTPQDFRRLESLLQIVRNLKTGVLTGAAALAWQKRHLGLLPLQGAKDVEVSLQNQAFAHAEHLFRSLTGGSEK
jgi:hypothetical protein